MRQNKAQFIMDYYIVVPNSFLDSVTGTLNGLGIVYTIEPWPDDYCRVYVKKDGKKILQGIWDSLVSLRTQ